MKESQKIRKDKEKGLNPIFQIRSIASTSVYPFPISKVTNFIELSYTCLVDKRVARQLLGIEVVAGYRKLRVWRQGQRLVQSQGQQQGKRRQQEFVVVLILSVDGLEQRSKNKDGERQIVQKQQPIQKDNSDKQQMAISCQQNFQQKSTNYLYVPYNIYRKLHDIKISENSIENMCIQDISSQLQVEVERFPISYGPSLSVESIDQELQKITITNLKLNSPQSHYLKQLITKIIVHPKFNQHLKQHTHKITSSKSNSNSKQQQKQQFCFLMFPQLKDQRVFVDLEWLDECSFIKHLSKLPLQLRGNLVTMKRQNQKVTQNSQINCFKNYIQFTMKPKVRNLQLVSDKKNLYIAKFVPGKTLVQFSQTLQLHNPSLELFTRTIQISPIYKSIFTKIPYYHKIHQQFFTSSSTENPFTCLRSDKSIGIGSFLNEIVQQKFKDIKFIKINCEKFYTLGEFFNRLKLLSNQGNTFVFIKNITWLQNLSKNEEIVQDTMKSLIEKIQKAITQSYQFSMSRFSCVLYFSHSQIPQQLPKRTQRMNLMLDKQQKIDILQNIFTYFLHRALPLTENMQQTIKNMLINSVGWTRIYKFLLNLTKTPEQLTEKTLTSIIQKTFSLQNVQNVTEVSWSDIGGLETAKEEIIQTVLLPTKHPEIFDEWIRPRTGLLFYGPPGTGKTLLGKCIAKQCKMGFISVKGPQLLNMYVGESQKNVRQVFERAKESKPCIVFMDELDALVPIRGKSSDSNAVMDRIVAELLMQIDMASENQVFVIGATNRPDLLDPSILRAGRFDKQIYLGISKNKEDRIKILKAQTRNSRLQQNFDFQEVQKNVPQNFTGADFYGLTSKSMMRAVQRSIEEYSSGLCSDPEVLITTNDFMQTLPSVKSSVSEEELRHYETLKEKFSF